MNYDIFSNGLPHEDTRVVFGFRCVWWSGIENVGRLRKDPASRIPGCPHCGGPLMEVPSPAEWWSGVDQYEAEGHPGYHSFIEWLKGKCFPDRAAAKAAYEAKPGRKAGF